MAAAPTARRDGRGIWLLLVGLALPTAVALGRVFVGTDALRLGYALSEQQARHRSQTGRQRELQAELAAAVAPARLVGLGRRWQLGPPQPAQIMVGPAVAGPRRASAQQAPAPAAHKLP